MEFEITRVDCNWSIKKGCYSATHNCWQTKAHCYVLWKCKRADDATIFRIPEPKPRSFNPFSGASEESDIAYTQKKGWMDAATFAKFIDHFDKFAGTDRPVVLLMDSVSSHVDHTVFMSAKNKGIELYKIVPNATHLMQPLDKGVFGPLNSKWHMVARKYSRENRIGKEAFAEKLSEAIFRGYLHFYTHLTVINSFKSSGIYPVNASAISNDQPNPGQNFSSSDPETKSH